MLMCVMEEGAKGEVTALPCLHEGSSTRCSRKRNEIIEGLEKTEHEVGRRVLAAAVLFMSRPLWPFSANVSVSG